MRSRSVLVLAVSLALAACSGKGGDASGGATCGSGDQVLVAGIDPNGTRLAIGGTYVYYLHIGGTDSTFSRVPVAGGPVEMLAADVEDFAVNAAGAVVWRLRSQTIGQTGNLGQGQNDGTSLAYRDAAGAPQTLALPAGATSPTSLGVDAAGDVFVTTSVNDPGSQPGVATWRWSIDRQAFDRLHRVVGTIQGYYPDGDGMAWLAPSDAGVSLFHEDVTGGTPVIGPTVKSANTQVIGLDAKKVYLMGSGSSVVSIDRASSVMAPELDLGSVFPNVVSGFVADDTHFYWLQHDTNAGTASIYRAAKDGGTPEIVTTAHELEAPAVGGCSIAALGVPKSGGEWGIITKPR